MTAWLLRHGDDLTVYLALISAVCYFVAIALDSRQRSTKST